MRPVLWEGDSGGGTCLSALEHFELARLYNIELGGGRAGVPLLYENVTGHDLPLVHLLHNAVLYIRLQLVEDQQF